jgi:fucose 4-O-acetylase-like acetyltransferase
MAMNQKRIAWIDTAKGIGISLVVFGHDTLSIPLLTFIYSFHIPLFFFLSGYLFSTKKYPKFGPFLMRKVQTLVIPYFLFVLILYLYWVFVARHFGAQTENNVSLLQPLWGALYGSNKLTDIFVALWFINCLFLTSLIFYWFKRIFKNYAIIIALILSIIGFWLSRHLSFRLPWSLDTAMLAILFYGAGHEIKQAEILKKISQHLSKYRLIIYSLIFLGFNLLLSRLNGRVDMFTNYYGNYFLFYLAAFAGIILIVFVAMLLDKNRLLEFLGQNSLYIFAFHPVALGILKFIFSHLYSPLAEGNLMSAVTLTLTCLLGLGILIYAIRKWMPLNLQKIGFS